MDTKAIIKLAGDVDNILLKGSTDVYMRIAVLKTCITVQEQILSAEATQELLRQHMLGDFDGETLN